MASPISPQLVLLVSFAVGLLLGSFLNVCIARLPYHESIAKPRSHCPACLHPIAWYDNIPLLSFVLLRGRCRKCFQAISWQYPAVEVATGLWFAWIVHASFLPITSTQHLGDDLSASIAPLILFMIGRLLLGFLLIGLIVMDWQTHTLPDAFTLTGAAIGFLLTCAQAIFLPAGSGDVHLHNSMRVSSPGSMVERGDVFLTGPESLVFSRLTAVVAAFLILFLIRTAYKAVRKQEGLGLGDAKLLAMIAAFLGFWPAILALFLGVVTCSLYALTLTVRRRATSLTRLPLGTFLALGGLVAALFGTPLIRWYSSLF